MFRAFSNVCSGSEHGWACRHLGCVNWDGWGANRCTEGHHMSQCLRLCFQELVWTHRTGGWESTARVAEGQDENLTPRPVPSTHLRLQATSWRGTRRGWPRYGHSPWLTRTGVGPQHISTPFYTLWLCDGLARGPPCCHTLPPSCTAQHGVLPHEASSFCPDSLSVDGPDSPHPSRCKPLSLRPSQGWESAGSLSVSPSSAPWHHHCSVYVARMPS